MAKKEYDVCVPITGIIWVTVETGSEKEAIDAALLSPDLKTENIDQWEAHRQICTGNVLHASQNEAFAKLVNCS